MLGMAPTALRGLSCVPCTHSFWRADSCFETLRSVHGGPGGCGGADLTVELLHVTGCAPHIRESAAVSLFLDGVQQHHVTVVPTRQNSSATTSASTAAQRVYGMYQNLQNVDRFFHEERTTDATLPNAAFAQLVLARCGPYRSNVRRRAAEPGPDCATVSLQCKAD